MKTFLNPDMLQEAKQFCSHIIGYVITTGVATVLVLAYVTTGLIVILNDRVANEVNKNK